MHFYPGARPTFEVVLVDRLYLNFGVDRMQRNFEPMRKQVEAWQRCELTNVAAKVVIYEACVEGRLEAPKHLSRTVVPTRALAADFRACRLGVRR